MDDLLEAVADAQDRNALLLSQLEQAILEVRCSILVHAERPAGEDEAPDARVQKDGRRGQARVQLTVHAELCERVGKSLRRAREPRRQI